MADFHVSDLLHLAKGQLQSTQGPIAVLSIERRHLDNYPLDSFVEMAGHMADTKNLSSRYTQEGIDAFNARFKDELQENDNDYLKLQAELAQKASDCYRSVGVIDAMTRLIDAADGSRGANPQKALKTLQPYMDESFDFAKELEKAKAQIEAVKGAENVKAPSREAIDNALKAIKNYGADFTKDLLAKGQELAVAESSKKRSR